MADSNGPIASAVVVPEPEPPGSPPKRRRSSSAHSTSKRPRLSEDAESRSSAAKKESPVANEYSKDVRELKPVERSQDRRKSSVQEERKRGQRLFGGLLSTLSQSTPNGQQKRRLEIEKRQQEKAKQQKAADEGRRAEKLANLKAVRKEEQIKYDEQAMKTRHSNLLAMAHFLSTRTEPKLYYKPWELLPRDEDRIKQQITESEALISREVEEFNARHPKPPSTQANEDVKTNGASKETVGEHNTESPSVSNVIDTTNSPSVQVPLSDQVTAEKEKQQAQEEHNGEVVVENEEDTVIY